MLDEQFGEPAALNLFRQIDAIIQTNLVCSRRRMNLEVW